MSNASHTDIIRVFIGHDHREPDATKVCEESIRRHTEAPVLIEHLDLQALRRSAMYRRWSYQNSDSVQVDGLDDRPFSSEFSFSRFLIPALCQWRGKAIFCDSDFMFREDISHLWDEFNPGYAVQVAKQNYASDSPVKKRLNVPQENYERKNWSSLILWNCEHPANTRLTTYSVNSQPGWWLHGFRWLDDNDIGSVLSQWNWIEGTTQGTDPLAVHFTMGTPDIPEYSDSMFAEEWLDIRESVKWY